MSAYCSRCCQHGHSSDTCPEGDFKIFEVQPRSFKRSASTGHLRRDSRSDYGDGYASKDLEFGRRPRKGVPEKPVNSNRDAASVQKLSVSIEFASSAKSRDHRRQYSDRETRKEIRSNLLDIAEEEEDNFDANAMPFLAETESPAFLLLESYSPRDGSNPKVNNSADEDTRSPAVSSNGTEYYSCMDTKELSEINIGSNEAHQRTNDSCKKVALKWIFVTSNFFLEVLAAIFDQLSSPHSSCYALISLLAAFTAIVICTIEIVYKGQKQKVTWGIRGKIYWFYHPSPSHKPFGTFKDICAFVFAFFQLISAAISYTFYCLHIDSPIKISFCSLAFAICLLCCNFFNDHDKVALS